MSIVGWIVMGLVAGVIAKLLMPGNDPGGCLITIALGIAGGILGGFIGTRIGWGTVNAFDIRSLLLAVGGSMLLLVIYRLLKKQPVT
jgi:uncharacterized membrane protein YeaQ/YmgE (transglycosylase-associated protein family)